MTDNNFLTDSQTMFYWLGFLIADGNFSFPNYTIRLRIHNKDLHHLNKFCDFSGAYIKPVNETISGAYLSNKRVFEYLTSRFSIHPNKTKNPIDLELIPYEYRLSFILGFIDGDGSIYTSVTKSIRDNRSTVRTFLKIQIDRSWLTTLGSMSIFLLGENRVKLKLASHKKSYVSELVINNHRFLKDLYDKVLELSIPYLNRKWDKCKEIPDNFYDAKEDLYNKVFTGIAEGLTAKEIAAQLGITRSRVYQIKASRPS